MSSSERSVGVMNRHYTFMPTNIKINCRFPRRFSSKVKFFLAFFLCKAQTIFFIRFNVSLENIFSWFVFEFFSLLLASRKIAYSIKCCRCRSGDVRQCLLIIFMKRTRGRRSYYMAGRDKGRSDWNKCQDGNEKKIFLFSSTKFVC